MDTMDQDRTQPSKGSANGLSGGSHPGGTTGIEEIPKFDANNQDVEGAGLRRDAKVPPEPVARDMEPQSKFDGMDYPSWLGFNPLKKLDEPFTFPFPPVEGDPWEKVSRTVKLHDDHMCDGWVEEIQNILIFAGLFSAVVTAFAVETQKLLQPDPNVLTVRLLTQITNQLATNTSTSSTPDIGTQNLDISFQTRRINAFIFISLILALGTALIGILALQWIRSYKRQELRSHQDQLSIRQSRYQALMDWKVPQIITALPILLQVALVLFFIGLVDMLKSLDSIIATITGVVVGIILALVLFTTVVPAIYIWLIHHTYSRKPTPIPPYCSPQSWLFYQLSVFINGLWWLLCGQFGLRQKVVASWDDFHLRAVPHHPERSFNHWLSPALGWVFQNLTTHDSFCAAYHCFQTLSKRDIAEEIVMDYLWKGQVQKQLHDYNQLQPASYFAVLSLYVLQFRFQNRAPPRDLHLYSMELGLRAMICNKPRYDKDGNRKPIPFPTKFMLKLEPGSSKGLNKLEGTSHYLNIMLVKLTSAGTGDNLWRQFEVFWDTIVKIQGTPIAEDSLHGLQDWIRSVPLRHCETDRVRLRTCIITLVAYFPLKSKTSVSASRFCNSDAILKLLDAFMDNAEVQDMWVQTINNWPESLSMLDYWDLFLVSLRIDKKYWVLGSKYERLSQLEQELLNTGQLSMELPRAVSTTPRPQSRLTVGHRRILTMFTPSVRTSRATLPFTSQETPAPGHLIHHDMNTIAPESMSGNPPQNRISIYSIPLSHQDDQTYYSSLSLPEDTHDQLGNNQESSQGSISIFVDKNPTDLNTGSDRPDQSPIERHFSSFTEKATSSSIHIPQTPPYPLTGSPTLDHPSPPSSPGPFNHFLDPITWAIEVPAATSIEENQTSWVVRDPENIHHISSTPQSATQNGLSSPVHDHTRTSS
ncbi:hypothetical protein CVT24_007092 [Panaeolus cyanescens]|uniref:DUF6535 domain-containing protein n=1 Tax=Panaeolus cyanescens TaxID=181874 RepID=A0A409YP52_9AGAR|nr:hypothetical protein CVT24_007092 [Panaeolus cyanescens]